MEPFIPYVIIAAGLFAMAGGIFNWGFFINSRKARLWVRLFGQGGARIFYVVLGLAIAVVGALLAAGVLENKNPG